MAVLEFESPMIMGDYITYNVTRVILALLCSVVLEAAGECRAPGDTAGLVANSEGPFYH